MSNDIELRRAILEAIAKCQDTDTRFLKADVQDYVIDHFQDILRQRHDRSDRKLVETELISMMNEAMPVTTVNLFGLTLLPGRKPPVYIYVKYPNGPGYVEFAHATLDDLRRLLDYDKAHLARDTATLNDREAKVNFIAFHSGNNPSCTVSEACLLAARKQQQP
jgi:hypothetical protein